MKAIITSENGWHNGLWGRSVDICLHNPGEKLPDMLWRLFEAGLQEEDIRHIEYCNHPKLMHPSWRTNSINGAPWVGEVGRGDDPAYQIPKWVAWYLGNWADTIEAFHARRADLVTVEKVEEAVIVATLVVPTLELAAR